jgi:hypothetical protein
MRYSFTSGARENNRDQFGLGAYENEYTCEGMSTAQPG